MYVKMKFTVENSHLNISKTLTNSCMWLSYKILNIFSIFWDISGTLNHFKVFVQYAPHMLFFFSSREQLGPRKQIKTKDTLTNYICNSAKK